MKIIYCIILSLLLTSCVTTEEIIIRQPINRETSIENLSNSYNNKADSCLKYEQSLIAVLQQRFVFRYKKEIQNWRELKVKITINNNRLQVDGFYKDSLVYHKSYKGTVKENYFDINRKTRYFGIPFFMIFNDSKIILSIDENENLILSQANYSAGWIIMGANFIDYRNFIYKKLE